MAATKFKTAAERETHLNKVAELYGQGMMQKDIAVECKVSRPQISYDVQWLHEKWAEARVNDLNQAKIRELAKLDILEREATEAWERSFTEKEQTHRKGRLLPAPAAEDGKTNPETLQIVEVNVRSERQTGDPRFLDVIMRCITQRCKILGLEAPVKFDSTVRTYLSEEQKESVLLEEARLLTANDLPDVQEAVLAMLRGAELPPPTGKELATEAQFTDVLAESKSGEFEAPVTIPKHSETQENGLL